MPTLTTNILTMITEQGSLPFSFCKIREAHRQRFPAGLVPFDRNLCTAIKALRAEGKIAAERRPEGFVLILMEPNK